VHTVTDPKNVSEVSKALKAVVSSKQNGYEELLSNLIAKACVSVCPKNPKSFNVDNVFYLFKCYY
jgi:T-complex protein 1 subunit theta